VVALAVSSAAAVEEVQQGIGASYPMLADSDHQVSEAYGVYNLLGDYLAAPAVFIINVDRQVVWHYVGVDANDRLSAESILSHLP
jgi:peroxiredoxin